MRQRHEAGFSSVILIALAGVIVVVAGVTYAVARHSKTKDAVNTAGISSLQPTASAPAMTDKPTLTIDDTTAFDCAYATAGTPASVTVRELTGDNKTLNFTNVTNSKAVSCIYTDIHNLPVFPAGTYNCPNDDSGAHLDFVFSDGTQATTHNAGCELTTIDGDDKTYTSMNDTPYTTDLSKVLYQINTLAHQAAGQR